MVNVIIWNSRNRISIKPKVYCFIRKINVMFIIKSISNGSIPINNWFYCDNWWLRS